MRSLGGIIRFRGNYCSWLANRWSVSFLLFTAISQLNEPVATRQSKVATAATPDDEEYTLPKFSLLLVDIMAREGDDVTLESCVEGTPKPTVKWTLNNKDIVYDERVKVSPTSLLISIGQVFLHPQSTDWTSKESGQ